jgi:general secretion pathway protein D
MLMLVLVAFGCDRPRVAILDGRPQTGPADIAGRGGSLRLNGPLGSPDAAPPAQVSYGSALAITPPGVPPLAGGGDISLNFVDTDIREVVSQVLGGILRATYTIDPGVAGTATLRTAQPVARAQLLPILQTLLAQNGAALVQAGGIYRVLPAGAAPAAPAGAVAPRVAAASDGATVVPLRNASAEDLARVLQPFVGGGARITADAGRNLLLVGGDPQARDVLLGLVQAFDVDLLAGQSYALLPVTSGDARDFASAMQDALRGQGGGALAGVVRVVPMQRINAVLVVSAQRSAIDQARRVYALVERGRRQSVRGWSVYFLQNNRSNDIAYVLQQAFTPRNVTAQPTPAGSTAPGRSTRQLNSTSGGTPGGVGGLSGVQQGGGSGGGIGGSSGGSSLGSGSVGSGPAPGLGGGSDPGGQTGGLGGGQQTSANPLLGGLDPSGGPGGGGEAAADTMRIVPNPQNNALLIYATPQERDTVEAALRRLDILPLQVRIDAVIAEVTLNDALQFGTQFFFREGSVSSALGNAASTALGNVATTALTGAIPGYVFAAGAANSRVAISALQSVTDVRVLSSPQLMVLDNEPARLQVGSLVPFLTQSAQSTLTTGAPVVNSIAYRETGVIMEVTPRVNSGGLVTLDIAQEVSDVDPSQTTRGLNSPTFLQRTVRSRVAVQDGQTIGLAGLIRDNVTTGNGGIPWLRSVPLLGALVSQQDNRRQRTELLVLITPRVIHDQRDARSLTEDLKAQLPNAAVVPSALNGLPPTGSPDPQRRVRRRLGLEP